MKKLLVSLTFILCASVANAQSLPNPTGASFTPSIDHSIITSYEIGYFLSGATDPVQLVDIGKPTPDLATNTATVVINTMPLAFNAYVAKIRAKAGTMYSEWSEPSNPFQRVPGKPGKPVVK